MRTVHPERLDESEQRLIAELYPSLRSFASVVRSPGDDANDLVQEALFRVLRSRGTISDLEFPAAYLRRTIIHLAQDRQRSEQRRQAAWARLDHNVAETPIYTCELDELRSLPPRMRAVLYLNAVEGWTYREIAQMIGGSEVSARVAASRGRRRVRSVLTKESADV